MKIIAQGDPIEYEVEDAPQACVLYRQDMTQAMIGVVTHRTDHQRAKEALARIAKLEKALAGLIGAESQEELQAMEAVIRITPVPDADKAAMLNAIHVLSEGGL